MTQLSLSAAALPQHRPVALPAGLCRFHYLALSGSTLVILDTKAHALYQRDLTTGAAFSSRVTAAAATAATAAAAALETCGKLLALISCGKMLASQGCVRVRHLATHLCMHPRR